MTTVFIWNNNQVKAKLHALGIKQSEADRHGVTGHAAVNIDDSWCEPFTNTETVNTVINEFDEADSLEMLPFDYNSVVDLPLDEIFAAQEEYNRQARELAQEKLAAKQAFDNCFTDNRDSYVSWWPGEGESHRSRGGSNGQFRRGEGNRSFWVDLLDEVYAPDHVIRIPHTQKQAEKMKAKWLKEKTKNDGNSSYRFYRKNCSRMASKILHSGFKSSYKHGYGVKRAFVSIWTPLEVKRQALNVKGARTMSWEDFVCEMWEKVYNGQFAQRQALVDYARRASNRGSSGGQARFNFNAKGSRVGAALDKNTMQFLVPPLTIEAANLLAYHLFEVAEIRRVTGENVEDEDAGDEIDMDD